MAEKEYIEREEILQKLSRMIEYCEKDNNVNGLTALFQVGDVIIDCKSADVQKVRHGEWIINSDGYYPYCSECGKEPKEMSEFCPKCGAKMKMVGEQE